MRISDWSSDVCSSDLRSFEIEEGASILTTALDQHINLPYGCRLGTCCSCRGKVISGSVDFGNAHPAYLPQSQRDQGYALLCSATPLSDLTIEIDELPPLIDPIDRKRGVKGKSVSERVNLGGR